MLHIAKQYDIMQQLDKRKVDKYEKQKFQKIYGINIMCGNAAVVYAGFIGSGKQFKRYISLINRPTRDRFTPHIHKSAAKRNEEQS